jgi:hypothetical protein
VRNAGTCLFEICFYPKTEEGPAMETTPYLYGYPYQERLTVIPNPTWWKWSKYAFTIFGGAFALVVLWGFAKFMLNSSIMLLALTEKLLGL